MCACSGWSGPAVQLGMCPTRSSMIAHTRTPDACVNVPPCRMVPTLRLLRRLAWKMCSCLVCVLMRSISCARTARTSRLTHGRCTCVHGLQAVFYGLLFATPSYQVCMCLHVGCVACWGISMPSWRTVLCSAAYLPCAATLLPVKPIVLDSLTILTATR